MFVAISIVPGFVLVQYILGSRRFDPSDWTELLAIIFLLVFFGAFWLHIASSRYIVQGRELFEKRYGFTIWRIAGVDAEVRLLEESGFNYWLVYNRTTGKRVGKINCVQFHETDLQNLLRALFPDAEIVDEIID
jgi:hypothetical protein